MLLQELNCIKLVATISISRLCRLEFSVSPSVATFLFLAWRVEHLSSHPRYPSCVYSPDDVAIRTQQPWDDGWYHGVNGAMVPG